MAPASPGRAAGPQVTLLAHGFGAPDDLAWGPHSSIYFSDFGNNAVDRLDSNGRVSVVWRNIRGPEGIVVEPDGSLVVAEQVPNRVLHLDLARRSRRVIATLANPSSRLGIDGIARDPRDGSIIVPDSPVGTVLRITLSGRVRVIASGLGRPVGALVLPDRSILVVDEHLNGAFRLSPAGTVRRFGGFLSVPDDAVSDGRGGFYVSCLGDGTIRHLGADGAAMLTAANLPNPQGLLRRADGALIVAEESANRIVAVQ
jgi:adhesin HecA-like repeat protein